MGYDVCVSNALPIGGDMNSWWLLGEPFTVGLPRHHPRRPGLLCQYTSRLTRRVCDKQGLYHIPYPLPGMAENTIDACGAHLDALKRWAARHPAKEWTGEVE